MHLYDDKFALWSTIGIRVRVEVCFKGFFSSLSLSVRLPILPHAIDHSPCTKCCAASPERRLGSFNLHRTEG